MWIAIAGLTIFLLLAIWEIWVCEGAHLGRRFVVWLYDLAATRYDRIKSFDQDWEQHFLGEPVAAAMYGMQGMRLLDVGAGTGRLIRALRPFQKLNGIITCVEPSKHMLAIGRSFSTHKSTHWVRAWEKPLPFADDAFDIVVSLEILEFTPNPVKTLHEMARVLRPGGWLVITNRVSREAPFIFGRTFSRKSFPMVLEGIGLQDVEAYPWQVDYDLVWARKAFQQDNVRLRDHPLGAPNDHAPHRA
jgi:ubiquinone/menaquinone biosynthesis C-methylase UbiE